MDEQPPHFYDFSDFRLDTAKRLLWREGEVVSLMPKAFDVLRLLVSHHGQVVGKDELLSAVWHDTAVEENNLNVNISALRKAFGEKPHEHRFIVTIPGMGYKFVADVREVWDEPESAQFVGENRSTATTGEISSVASTSSTNKSQSWSFKKPILLAVGAGILILTGFGLSRWWRSGTITQENQAPFQSARLTRLTSGKALQVALAPDGKNIAYVKEETDGQSLWLRQVGVDSELRLIAPEQVNYLNVAFGGDGEVIYYTTTKANQGAGTIYEVPSLGGTPRKLLERVSSPFGLSHDDKHFAFLRAGEKEGTTSLIVANADGTDERQIAMTREPERWWGGMPPMWSPNGSRLACLTMNTGNVFGKFVAVRLNDGGIEDLTPNEWKLANGGEWTTNGLLVSAQQRDEDLFQLWHINPANGEARRVTNDLHDYFSVSLNAAGRTLATVQSVALTNVWLVDLSGASATRQTTSGAGVYWDISFTPDGKLLYSSRMSGLADIWQMDLDGANRLQLTKKAGSNYGPVVSPDGRYLFFHSNRAATYFIYRAHGDGSQPERLTNQTIEEATADCSPDGKTVVFVNYTPSGFPLKRVSVEGGTPILLSDKWVNQPAISPDGKLVACWYTETWGEAWRLALIPLETGGAPIKTFSVPPTAAWGGRIRWTPDGRGLLYVDTRNGVSNIWQQATDGGVPVQVTNFETEVIFSFALTPDGKQLACVRGTIAQDVVLLSDQPND